jgi:hypothetical protein
MEGLICAACLTLISVRKKHFVFLLSEAGPPSFSRPGRRGYRGRATEDPQATGRGSGTDIIRSCDRHNSGL